MFLEVLKSAYIFLRQFERLTPVKPYKPARPCLKPERLHSSPATPTRPSALPPITPDHPRLTTYRHYSRPYAHVQGTPTWCKARPRARHAHLQGTPTCEVCPRARHAHVQGTPSASVPPSEAPSWELDVRRIAINGILSVMRILLIL